MTLALSVFSWISVLGIFNEFFKSRIYKKGKYEFAFTDLFFITCFILTYSVFFQTLKGYITYLVLAWVTTSLFGFFLSYDYLFYKRIKKGRYYLISLPSNLLFQQTVVCATVLFINQYCTGISANLIFGAVFFVLHIPIIFCRWVKLRYLYLILAFFGGMIFSFLITNYGGFGVTLSFLVHLGFYVPIFYYLRDETKI